LESEEMKVLKQSFISTIILFLLCGVMYPYFVTGISKVLFKEKANGSLIYVDGKVVGSKLIGQKFTEEKYFHGRPSAYDYNTYDEKPDETVLASSGGTNYANSNPDYIKGVEDNTKNILKENPTIKQEDISSEMVTASGSGLDPNITLQGAMIQVDRISEARNISKDEVIELIKANANKDIVNVLELNLALDDIK
jgi:K+-transporting ATPase ATPase C chain